MQGAYFCSRWVAESGRALLEKWSAGMGYGSPISSALSPRTRSSAAAKSAIVNATRSSPNPKP